MREKRNLPATVAWWFMDGFWRPRIHFVSFYTEGSPFDRGPNLTHAAQQLEKAVKPEFDSMFFHTPRVLLRRDPTWEQSFRDFTAMIERHPSFSEEQNWNTGWARLGLFAWKPRLIFEALNESDVRHGDLLFYHDSDTHKYPQYLNGVEKWRRWLLERMRRVDVLVFRDNRARLVSDTKPEVWEQFFTADEVSGLRHLWAGAFAVRKSTPGIEFVRKWKQLAEVPENLLPITRAAGEQYFSQHGPDQALLACLRHCRREWPAGLRLREVYLEGGRMIPPPKKPAWALFRGKRPE